MGQKKPKWASLEPEPVSNVVRLEVGGHIQKAMEDKMRELKLIVAKSAAGAHIRMVPV